MLEQQTSGDNFLEVPSLTLKKRLELYCSILEWSKSRKVSHTEREEKMKQKLELMTYRDDFADEVKSFRVRFKMSIGGFENFDDCMKWTDGLIAQSEPSRYFDEHKEKAVARLEQGLREYVFGLPLYEYDDALMALLKLFDINERWKNAIEYYALFNRTDEYGVLPRSVVPVILPDKDKPALYVRIWPETKQKDIAECWSVIELWQTYYKMTQDLPSYREATDDEFDKAVQSMPDPIPLVAKQRSEKAIAKRSLEKYKRAYELHKKERRSFKETAHEIGCGYNEVPVFIKRFEVAIKANKLD